MRFVTPFVKKRLRTTGAITSVISLTVGGILYRADVVDRRLEDIASGVVSAEVKAVAWDELAPTLQPGDVILMMGTGDMSWKISRLLFTLSGLTDAAMHYSHVGVVVDVVEQAPAAAPTKWWWPLGGTASRRYQVRMLEAVDNRDASLPTVLDGVVRHKMVQVSDAADRIFGTESREGADYGRRLYKRAAVRRLSNFDWTPERREKLRSFIDASVGKPLETSPKMVLAHIDPSYRPRWPKNDGLAAPSAPDAPGDERDLMSCAELIADLYKYVGIIKPTLVDKIAGTVPPESSEDAVDLVPTVQMVPFHFTSEGQRWRPFSLVTFSDPNSSLGPEIPISMNVVPRKNI